MTAQLIEGRPIAEAIYGELREAVENLRKSGITPRLVVFLVGDNPASAAYVRMKSKACERLSIESETIRLPESTSEQTLLEHVRKANQDARTHGILIQMPLPPQIKAQRMIEEVHPLKDVDGFHPINKGRLQAGLETHVPCTPAGIQQMLHRSGHPVEGKHVVIIGRSQIVGMPLAILLAQKSELGNATVTLCHSASRNLAELTRRADIVIAAIGRPKMITADMLSSHSVVIDVGVNRVDDEGAERGYRLVGDVDFDNVVHLVKAISPVPGGVGPLTIAMLLKNTVWAAQKSILH